MASLAVRTAVARVAGTRVVAVRGFATDNKGGRPNIGDADAKLPDQAEIVVVGGGCVGLGVAYSLAKAGKKDILLLEKEPSLASVTSAQAAGLVGQVRTSVDRVKLAMWSVKTFAELEQLGNYTPGWRQVGSLRIAQTKERVDEFRIMLDSCKKAGLEVDVVTAAEAARRWPHMKFEEASMILWCPTDGYLMPYDLSMSYFHHGTKLGVKYATRAPVTSIALQNGKVASVTTPKGTVKCQTVINAAGAHAYHIAKMVGVELPIFPVRHEYFITEPVGRDANGQQLVNPTLPVLRIPDATLYARPDVNSVLLGGWEPQGVSVDPSSYTVSGAPPSIEPDWPVLHDFAQKFDPLYPRINSVGIRTVFAGWPTFTPDGKFIIGPVKQVPGFVMAGGCNAHGVSGSAGIGKHVVESMVNPNPEPYVKGLSPERFLSKPWDRATARRQAQHVYETYYCIQPQ